MSRFLTVAIQHPKRCLLLGLLFILICAAGLHKLVKNTSVDAFIPADHPSILSRDKVRQVFGLQDPLVVSISSADGSIFNPQSLNLLLNLHHQFAALANVRQVKSLVSEAHIQADDSSLQVAPLLSEQISTLRQAEDIGRKAMQMPPFIGTLVAYDQRALALVVELVEQDKADETYQLLLQTVAPFETTSQHIYVAGQGAVGGYLSKYIDTDSRRMQPVVVGTILLLLYLAFRQFKALTGPLVVILASALGAIGTMAWFNVPYYAITSALPVVITAIAVADAIHVLTAYYELKAQHGNWSQRRLVGAAMLDMARPITLTTLTTLAGFIGLSVASIMPPVKYFGLFAALGVLIAWLFTMLVLPALLILLRLPETSIFARRQDNRANLVGKALTRLSLATVRSPGISMTILLLIMLIAAAGAMHLRVDRAQVENFTAGEPIRIAHDHLNQHYAGSAYLDILISTDSAQGLVNSTLLEEVAALQDYLQSMQGVNKTQSILDPLGVLQAQLEGKASVSRFQGDEDSFSQYLLLFESSAKPTDYADKIDNQYQQMLVRAYLNTDLFSEEKRIVEALQGQLPRLFTQQGVSIELAGRVNVDYHWMTRLGDSHFRSIGISMLLVLVFSSLLFRSLSDGLICVAPVAFAILVVYGVMGWQGIFLEPATSMFAAIAIGVGIDFAIHFIERLQLALKHTPSLEEAIKHKFPSAARACFFNGAALACGFATLFVSSLPTLQRFGLMITLACLTSFFAALVMIPLAYRWRLRRSTNRARRLSINW
ncbi:hypothetical protein GCM10009092_09980 [Bowmanella denitrificans]|uniref:SSD domain-containing protein n=1 Tax=Bowmanella denitrificans TaxID=366582 RepID=A0ABP3GJS0_9ALTE